MQTLDPFLRIVEFFDKDETAGSFLPEDGDGGFVGAIYRMAREIDALAADKARLTKKLVTANAQLADMEFLSVEGFSDWKKDRRAALGTSIPAPADCDGTPCQIETPEQVAEDLGLAEAREGE